jgi:pyrroloquinoline quinone (PQQ) biosynthesis protein C
VRAEIIKDCVDEEVGDPEAGGRCHIDVLYEEAEAVGMKRQEIFDAVPTPPITACLHAWENLARSQHWVPAFAAIAGLEIIHSEPAIEARARLTSAEAANAYAEELGGTSFNDKLGVKAGDLVFLALHSHKDRFHGGGELSMLVKYANTRELQEESIWAARTSLEISAVHFGEINRLAAKAAGATELFASQNRASWL